MENKKKRKEVSKGRKKRKENTNVQEPSLSQTLQELVCILRSRDLNIAPKKKIEGIALWLKSFRMILTNIIIVISVLISTIFLILLFSHELSKGVVLIEPFEVPEKLEEQGYTGRVIANKLIGEINRIRAEANTSMVSSKEMKIAGSDPQIELEISGSGISFTSIMIYIKKLFGNKPTRVTGAIIIKNNQMNTSIHIDGKPGKTICPYCWEEDLEEILPKAAEYIYKHVEPYILAAYIFRKDDNEYKETIKMLQYLISHEPDDDDARAYNLWGIVLSYKRDNDGAIAKYNKAIDIKPDYHEAYINKGNALSDLGQNEAAIAAFDKAIELKPDYASAYNNKGTALYDSGNYEAAIAAFDKAIELKPDYYEAWYNKGNSFVKLEKHEAAIAADQRQLELPTDDN